MNTDRAPLSRVHLFLAALFILWSLGWAAFIWQDLAINSAIGRGEVTGAVETHHLWEVMFVMAHGGIRWFGGAALLAVAWILTRLRLRGGFRQLEHVAGD